MKSKIRAAKLVSCEEKKIAAPKQLTMNISITFEVPFGKVSLASLEETVRKSLQKTGRLMMKATLEAIQERFLFIIRALSPGRFKTVGTEDGTS